MASLRSIMKSNDSSEIQQLLYIFFSVLIGSFLVHVVAKSIFGFYDQRPWADQLKYFLNHDPREFNLFGEYGHPGTTITVLGRLFRVVFGMSYESAVTFSTSTLIAVPTAACSTLCFLLYPHSSWWLSTALLLPLNRLYFGATPPTSIIMPFVVLIVLATWWLTVLHRSRISNWLFCMWGCIAGTAMATRFDVSLAISLPMFLLIWSRHGRRAAAPVLLGSMISLAVFDPYLWIMPVRHIADMMDKFTIHYSRFKEFTIETDVLINTIWLAMIGQLWSVVTLVQRRPHPIIPVPIIVTFSGITALSTVIIFSSKYQAIRYLFPFCMVWEVFLPLIAIETLSPSSNRELSTSLSRKIISISVISLLVLIQFITYLIWYLYGLA